MKAVNSMTSLAGNGTDHSPLPILATMRGQRRSPLFRVAAEAAAVVAVGAAAAVVVVGAAVAAAVAAVMAMGAAAVAVVVVATVLQLPLQIPTAARLAATFGIIMTPCQHRHERCRQNHKVMEHRCHPLSCTGTLMCNKNGNNKNDKTIKVWAMTLPQRKLVRLIPMDSPLRQRRREGLECTTWTGHRWKEVTR